MASELWTETSSHDANPAQTAQSTERAAASPEAFIPPHREEALPGRRGRTRGCSSVSAAWTARASCLAGRPRSPCASQGQRLLYTEEAGGADHSGMPLPPAPSLTPHLQPARKGGAPPERIAAPMGREGASGAVRGPAPAPPPAPTWYLMWPVVVTVGAARLSARLEVLGHARQVHPDATGLTALTLGREMLRGFRSQSGRLCSLVSQAPD